MKTLDELFCAAVSAIDAGDVVEVERLVTAHPALVRDRLEAPGAWLRDTVGDALEGFFQKPYLLWFVAEDPVRTGAAIGRLSFTGSVRIAHTSLWDDWRA